MKMSVKVLTAKAITESSRTVLFHELILLEQPHFRPNKDL